MPIIPEENKRTGSIRVRLSPELLERLESLAKRYGMPVSTLSAFAIARFVQSEEMNRMVVMDTARQQVKAMTGELTDERMERVFGAMIDSMLSGSTGKDLAALLVESRGGQDEDPKTKT